MQFITKTNLFKYTEHFTTENRKFSDETADIFYMSAQNIDCGTYLNRLSDAVLTSTHNLWFWAEIRKNDVYAKAG